VIEKDESGEEKNCRQSEGKTSLGRIGLNGGIILKK
jgi:hypothetical protein